jgi:hypothetical protein
MLRNALAHPQPEELRASRRASSTGDETMPPSDPPDAYRAGSRYHHLVSERLSTRVRRPLSMRATHARDRRTSEPVARDLTPELLLMTDDIQSSRAKPVRRRFDQLLDALEQTHARYAVCGAVAMGAHGAERYTQAIDVLVEQDALEPVVDALSRVMCELGREPAHGLAKQVRLRSKRARGPRAIDIDLLVPVDAIEAWALATAVRARAFDRRVDVVSAEGLVVMKLQAYIENPESSTGGQHRADAMRLLETTVVDVPALRRFVRSHADLARELERAMAAPPARGRIP